MTVQELIDQLLAFCEKHEKDPAKTQIVIDYGCDYAGVETLDHYADDDEFTVVLN